MSPRRAAILMTDSPDQAETLREHLIAATAQLLDERSMGELTTRAIAHHAGVSDGVLYNHFDDKTDLLMAAMLRRYARLVERLEAATPTAGDGTVVGNVQAYGRALSEVEADAMLHGAALARAPAAAPPVLGGDPPVAVRHRPPAASARRLPGRRTGARAGAHRTSTSTPR